MKNLKNFKINIKNNAPYGGFLALLIKYNVLLDNRSDDHIFYAL